MEKKRRKKTECQRRKAKIQRRKKLGGTRVKGGRYQERERRGIF